jgi:hypothetical protein
MIENPECRGTDMEKPPGNWIHYSELKPFKTEGLCMDECETYLREVGRLIAEGHEGKHVLIHGQEIIGFFESDDEAHSEGYRRYLGMKALLVHQIRTFEPVIRVGKLSLYM